MCKLIFLAVLLSISILTTGALMVLYGTWIYFALFGIAVFFLSLLCMVLINLKSSKDAKEDLLDRHAMRRALMISFTVIYMILLFKESDAMGHFNLVYISMITFYFGSRGIEKYAEILRAGKKGK